MIMTLSVWLINSFGLVFGYVFPDLLYWLGLKKRVAFSPLAVFFLAFLALIGFLFASFFMQGIFYMIPLSEFYESEFFWVTVFLIVGGFLRLAQQYVTEKFWKK